MRRTRAARRGAWGARTVRATAAAAVGPGGGGGGDKLGWGHIEILDKAPYYTKVATKAY